MLANQQQLLQQKGTKNVSFFQINPILDEQPKYAHQLDSNSWFLYINSFFSGQLTAFVNVIKFNHQLFES